MTNQSTPTINHYVALIKLKSFDESIVFIEDVAQEIINYLDLKVVKKTSHLFSPKGVTLAYILSESHLVIHTWPEFSTIHIDLVTCSPREINEFENSVRATLNPEEILELSVRSVIIEKKSNSNRI